MNSTLGTVVPLAMFLSLVLIIGPESDHWLCLSLPNSLTDCCLVNLMAMNDTNCLMMSHQLLKAVKSFLMLKKVV